VGAPLPGPAEGQHGGGLRGARSAALEDPHNRDDRYTRVRLRHEVLPLLEDVLRGGVAGALARTAAQLREDAEVLDELGAELLARAEAGAELVVAELSGAPPALRRRALRTWLRRGRGPRTDRRPAACGGRPDQRLARSGWRLVAGRVGGRSRAWQAAGDRARRLM
jgi:tRNA(Ile)-lysidine synthase